MTPRRIPQAGGLVEIDVRVANGTAVRQITRTVVTVRDLGDGRYTCILQDDADGSIETVTIAPAQNGNWVCMEPPVNIMGAINIAERVERGDVLHGPASTPLITVCRALLHLTGRARPVGPRAPLRLNTSTPQGSDQ